MPREVNELGEAIGFAVRDWRAPDPPSRQPMVGRTCRLEVLDPERHASDLHEANVQDRENRIWTYLGYGPFESLVEYREWADEVSRSSDPLFHAIVDAATGKAVGVASYLRIIRDWLQALRMEMRCAQCQITEGGTATRFFL